MALLFRAAAFAAVLKPMVADETMPPQDEEAVA